jgi:hypothetical protein
MYESRKKRVVYRAEQEARIAEAVEQLPIDNDASRAELLLVWRGLKIATIVGVAFQNEPGAPAFKSEAEHIEARLRALGFLVRQGNFVRFVKIPGKKSPGKGGSRGDTTLPPRGYAEYYAARTREDLEKFYEIWNEEDEQRVCDEIGRMSGFPDSAIRAYRRWLYGDRKDNNLIIDQQELPEEIQEQNFMAFAQYRFSRENWQEELKTAKRWAEEIERIDPALYERMAADYHKNRKG